MRAMVLEAVGAPLVLKTLATPAVRRDEVLPADEAPSASVPSS